MVLFDLAAAQPDTVISLLTELPDLLLIGVDLANHQALVLSGEQPKLFTTDDFVRLVELHVVQAQSRDRLPLDKCRSTCRSQDVAKS